ncbi:hypothetical protein KSP40_PGU013428 [Platanthera guangdongensis]|uniref:Uncharacterized protein n=1 Tax=Platanthera guangdongensis TaxID=2320717 RepID=A0ABR2M744_9ASPA
MEKDFLGISRTDSGPNDSRGDRVDSAFPVGSVARWSDTNQPSSLQQFIPFKNTQLDEKPKPLFQPVSTAGSNTKPCIVQNTQGSFDIDRNNVQQVSIHASTYLAPVLHASAPIAMNSPFFMVHGSSNAPNTTCTAIKPRPLPSPIPNNNSLFGAGVGSFAPW